jgi:hypothetical protein
MCICRSMKSLTIHVSSNIAINLRLVFNFCLSNTLMVLIILLFWLLALIYFRCEYIFIYFDIFLFKLVLLTITCIQIQGLWKLKNQNLADLCKEAKELKDMFTSFQIKHVPRVQADNYLFTQKLHYLLDVF